MNFVIICLCVVILSIILLVGFFLSKDNEIKSKTEALRILIGKRTGSIEKAMNYLQKKEILETITNDEAAIIMSDLCKDGHQYLNQVTGMRLLLKKIMPEKHPDGYDAFTECQFNTDSSLRRVCLVENATNEERNEESKQNNKQLLNEVRKYYPQAKYENTQGKDGVPLRIEVEEGKIMNVGSGNKDRRHYLCASFEKYDAGFMPSVSWPDVDYHTD